MPEIITAIYENGVLRPLSPLPLQEHQTVRIQVLPEDSVAELERITQSLATAGLITPPSRCSDVEPVSEAAWGELIEKLKAIPGKPLSEILIEERGVGSAIAPLSSTTAPPPHQTHPGTAE